jgi:hypothetical protein
VSSKAWEVHSADSGALERLINQGKSTASSGRDVDNAVGGSQEAL